MYINKQTTAKAGFNPNSINILYQILEDFLNVVFILIKFLIEFGLNPALAVVCLFIYILFVCLFTYFISIISWSLKLEQITPPCWPCHEYFKVSNILYKIVEEVFKCRLHIKKIFNRVWIEFSLSCCLFVYTHIVRLFVYIFYINNQ